MKTRLAALFVLAVVAVGALPIAAQAPPAAPATKPGEVVKDVPVPAELDSTPPVYTYEVGGRRDPFRSLLVRNPNERKAGNVPQGVAGMLVDELELQGTIRTRGGWIAMMRGSDNKSYLLRKGNTVFDGEVTDITGSDITFRQNVNDPTSPKPFRDVVKSLALARKP